MYVIYRSRSGMKHYAWYDSYATLGKQAAKTLCSISTGNMDPVNAGGIDPVNCKRCNQKFTEILTSTRR